MVLLLLLLLRWRGGEEPRSCRLCQTVTPGVGGTEGRDVGAKGVGRVRKVAVQVTF
jgi:hypothetical protein